MFGTELHHQQAPKAMNPLTKLRELCSAASPGPWRHISIHGWDGVGFGLTKNVLANRDFIAAARTALPVLVDALEKAVEALHAVYDDVEWSDPERDAYLLKALAAISAELERIK